MKISKRNVLDAFRKHFLKLMFAAIVLIGLSLLFGTSVKTVVFTIGLIAIASFSTFYFNYVNAPVNFELVKLSTILMAVSHGIAAGLIVGVLSTIIGKVLIGRIDEKLPLSVAAISLLAVGAGIFSGVEIVVLGIVLVGIYNIALFSISQLMGGDLGWNIPYEGTNFAINFILFTRLAPLLLPLIR